MVNIIDGVPNLTNKNVEVLNKIQDKICANYLDYNLIIIQYINKYCLKMC